MPTKHLHLLHESAKLQESTKDIMTAGFAYGSVGMTSLIEINSILSFISLGAAVVLSGLRIFSWFERRRLRKIKEE